ncbi:Lrp/AsnC ligand binding domain-containing protein [Streptomyces sp. NPDC052109]|uniref:Lrp/AsnC ligand binding domain-containing protein n=1 Tax=Streptomyces sp. NPDC052109 TaxID=3155527 RepID=UPI0034372D1A
MRPADLERVALAPAAHDEPAFVAATTGRTDLVAQALCRDPAGLHRCLTQRLGALREVDALETSPVLRTLKAASPALRGIAQVRRGRAAPTRRGG